MGLWRFVLLCALAFAAHHAGMEHGDRTSDT